MSMAEDREAYRRPCPKAVARLIASHGAEAVADRGNGRPLLRIHRRGREWEAFHPTSDDVCAEDWEIVYADGEEAPDAPRQA